MNGISALAAFTRTRSGTAVWLTSAKSHFAGQSVMGRPSIRRGLLRLPAGLPAPFLRPPQPVELDCFAMPFFFCEWEAVGFLRNQGALTLNLPHPYLAQTFFLYV